MKSFVVIVLVAGLLGCKLTGMNPPGVPSEKVTATKIDPATVELVFKASQLDDSAIGFAGIRTPVYDAFSRLYTAGKPVSEQAKHLAEAASPAGRVYGYLILQHVAKAEADVIARQMARDQTEVSVMNGCIISHSTVSELVGRIRAGKRVINLPN